MQRLVVSSIVILLAGLGTAAADPFTGGTEVLRLHAEGAQVYECKADAVGQLAWTFREPVATLLAGGKTVGHHSAGPAWELADGSRISAKVIGRAPGAAVEDIPLLQLRVTEHQGEGLLGEVTQVRRLATRGGVLVGPCDAAGALRSIGYAADYVFLKDRAIDPDP